MARVKINQAGMRKLQQEVEKKTAAATEEANRAVAKHDTPEAKAKAFSDVMARRGITMDRAELVKRFRALMADGD